MSLEAERRSDQGREISAPIITGFHSFAQLIDLHLFDMREVGKPLGRSKEYTLRILRKHLGDIKLPRLCQLLSLATSNSTFSRRGYARAADIFHQVELKQCQTAKRLRSLLILEKPDDALGCVFFRKRDCP